jgi:hypothetical protein
MANDDAPTASAAAMASVLIVDIDVLLSRHTDKTRQAKSCSMNLFRKRVPEGLEIARVRNVTSA